MMRWQCLQNNARLIVKPSFYVFWAVFSLLDNEGILPIFLLAAVIHELGHVAAIYLCGGMVTSLTLAAGGAVLRQASVLSPPKTIAVSLSGPAAGVAAAWVACQFGWLTFAGANLLLSMFNCLPALPLDGGCALLALMQLAGCSARAEWRLAAVSRIAAVLFICGGVLLLLRTGRNASVLTVGLCLLAAQRPVLRPK